MLGTILIVILVLMLLGAVGSVAHLVPQQKLGLFPERRAGTACHRPAHPVAHAVLLIMEIEKVKGKTT